MGLSSQAVAAWMLAEKSGGAAQSRQSANNNDWLNIGYTDSGTYGSSDSIWRNLIAAADATAGWLKGQDTIPGYGGPPPGSRRSFARPASHRRRRFRPFSVWAGPGSADFQALYAQVGSQGAAGTH